MFESKQQFFGRVLMVLCVCVTLASCTNAAEQRKIEIAQQQGEPFEMTMIMPDPKNPQAHPASAWPASFQIPPYPNCSIYKVAVFEKGPKKGQGDVVFSAKLPPNQLEDWYREKLTAEGWQLQAKDPKAPGLVTGTRNGVACYMTISDYGSDSGNESTATVSVSPSKQ